MLSMKDATEKAKKLPPPKAGVVMTIKPIEVALAWLKLHGLGSVKTSRGNPRWEGDLLVVRKGESPVPTPPLAPPQILERDLERGEVEVV
jgi:hypothetical protein